jgi:hypothetical protein
MPFPRALQSVWQAAWLASAAFAVQGCSVYDGELVDPLMQARTSDSASATHDNPLIQVTSVRGDASFEPGPDETPSVRQAIARDADAGSADSRSEVRCGDGEVSGVEKCDLAIAQGEPGACPETCPALAACVLRVRNGTGCQTECVLRELTCESGDGCCPGNCTKDNDLDCSARCGDGIVQTTGGETCEPDTDKPCIEDERECADTDACTIDRLTGSAANCNATCTHQRIEEPIANDGCCPKGANAKTDPDCKPQCGNGVTEPGEDCDGSDTCDPSCRFINAMERKTCMDSARNDCERCACAECTASELACRLGSNRDANRLCDDILVCSQRMNCLGTPCYCGDSPGCTLPNGPCKTQVETAAGGLSLQVAQQVGDLNTPLGRSYAADQCRVTKCAAACRPPVTATK